MSLHRMVWLQGCSNTRCIMCFEKHCLDTSLTSIRHREMIRERDVVLFLELPCEVRDDRRIHNGIDLRWSEGVVSYPSIHFPKHLQIPPVSRQAARNEHIMYRAIQHHVDVSDINSCSKVTPPHSFNTFRATLALCKSIEQFKSCTTSFTPVCRI